MPPLKARLFASFKAKLNAQIMRLRSRGLTKIRITMATRSPAAKQMRIIAQIGNEVMKEIAEEV